MSATVRLLLDIDIRLVWQALARAEDTLAREDHHDARAKR